MSQILKEAEAPSPAGGDIVPGTYELVASTVHGFAPDEMTSAGRRTLVITPAGARYHAEMIAEDPTQSVGTSFDFTPVSNVLVTQATCPPGNDGTLEYTATGRFLLLHERIRPGGPNGTHLWTFERR